MKKNYSIIRIIAICAAIGAAFTAIFIFRREIRDFIKRIIIRLDLLRGREHYNDCCFDDTPTDFDDFEDVSIPF